jgi:hypothetical protein
MQSCWQKCPVKAHPSQFKLFKDAKRENHAFFEVYTHALFLTRIAVCPCVA